MFHGIDGHGWGMWGMGWWWLIGIIVLIVIIWLAAKGFNSSNRSEKPQKTPLDILKERYARGEIDKQEFEERKKDL